MKNKFKLSCIIILLVITLLSNLSYCATNNEVNSINTSNSSTNSLADTNNSANKSNPNSTNVSKDSASKEDVRNDDLFLTDTNVVLDKEVQGNVYIISDKATITAPVYGNIFIIAQDIEFKSSDPTKPVYISGSAYLLGNNINLSLYCQDLYVVGSSSLTISYDSCILRDIRSTVPTLNLYGIVRRNVYTDSSAISLENSDDQKGVIEGNLTYYNTEKLSFSEDLVVGDVIYNLKAIDQTPTWLSKIEDFLSLFIISILFLLLLTKFTPTIVKPNKDFALKDFGKTCLYGIIALILVPIVCLIFMCFFPGLALFVLPILFIYIAFIIIGFFAEIVYIAGLIEKNFKTKSILTSIGILFALNVILLIASFVSIISLILDLLLIISGFGLLIDKLLKKNKQE